MVNCQSCWLNGYRGSGSCFTAASRGSNLKPGPREASKLFWVITASFWVSEKTQAWREAWVVAGGNVRVFFPPFSLLFLSRNTHVRSGRLSGVWVPHWWGLHHSCPPPVRAVPQRKRTISVPEGKAAPSLPAAARAPGGGDGTPVRAAWLEFIRGWFIYVCYVGWFGCLFANVRCYANAAPVLVYPRSLSHIFFSTVKSCL